MHRKKSRLNRILAWTGLIILLLIFLFPLYWLTMLPENTNANRLDPAHLHLHATLATSAACSLPTQGQIPILSSSSR
jgi:ABC-type glycerol-3-phosphate transport system permease component